MKNPGRLAVLVLLFVMLFLGIWRQAANFSRLIGGESFSLEFRNTWVAISASVAVAALATLLAAYLLRERR